MGNINIYVDCWTVFILKVMTLYPTLPQILTRLLADASGLSALLGPRDLGTGQLGRCGFRSLEKLWDGMLLHSAWLMKSCS